MTLSATSFSQKNTNINTIPPTGLGIYLALTVMTSLGKPGKKRGCKTQDSLPPGCPVSLPSDLGTYARLTVSSSVHRTKGHHASFSFSCLPGARAVSAAHFDPRSFSSRHSGIVFLPSIGFTEIVKAQRLYKLPED